MRRARTSATAVAASASPVPSCLFGLLFVLAALSMSCWMGGNTVLVDAAHPQRLVKDFMDDGTPVWTYIDLPPLDVALDSMDGKFSSGDDEVDEEGRKLGAEDDRRLQSRNGCPAQSSDYPRRNFFTQDVYIILYDVTRTMRAGEQKAFERTVKSIWNDPDNK